MKNLLLTLLLAAPLAASAQNGAITPDVMARLQKANPVTVQDRALRNALATNSIDALATSAQTSMTDTYFSHEAPSKGITDQQSSGRCWLFTGLNVMRAKVIAEQDLGAFQFSQSYCFFYDQLEKCNLFLQATIDKAALPMSDQTVEWLFKNPLSDGGTFTGVANLVTKYGVVPAEVFPETFCSNNTSAMATQLKTKLREDGLRLRQMYAAAQAANAGLKGKKAEAAEAKILAEMENAKVEMLKDVYHVLAICLGVPPAEFEYSLYNAKNELISTKKYTPKSFYEEMCGKDLENNYVMLMNDPLREYYKVYEIEYDRHVYDGQNWLYINLPIEDIKKMAIASIKEDNAMYFSCDVGKFLNRQKGVADINNFDYASLLGIDFGMNKAERVKTHASGSSHAMTLIAVDIKDGQPVKWMVENSWGETGYKGKLIMTDEWFNEYMFRLVVEKKYVPADILKLLDGPVSKLPAWDPMFLAEE